MGLGLVEDVVSSVRETRSAPNQGWLEAEPASAVKEWHARHQPRYTVHHF